MRNYEGDMPYNNYDEPRQRKTTRKKKKTKSNLFFSDFIAKNPADLTLTLLVIGLSVIGLIEILSSSYYNAIQAQNDGLYFFKKQLLFFCIGLVFMFIASKINFNVYKNLAAPILYYGSLVLLVYVLLRGDTFLGATRWIEIGPISFQPSEFAKIGLILFLALQLSMRKPEQEYEPKEKLKFWQRIGHSLKIYKKELIFIIIPVFLIGVENWSTAIVLFVTAIVMLYISGFRIDKCVPSFLILLVLFIAFIKIGGIGWLKSLDIADGKYNKRLQRFETWLDPFSDPLDTGYQTVQSLYAIGSGGISGVGLGKSKQKLGYIPLSYNDMIFTIICEEFGFFGALVIVVIFITLIVKCIKIAMRCTNKFALYYTVGMTSLIALQVIVNIGVVTGALPNTGMPLPFISYGGTALMMELIGMGIVLSISRYQE
ncbi:MAG: FtsW/RodA/SpoVE family cell cycle protein [Clostridia bacterium]|nr:FtsW/RodA/SpoVE family cell cycle protein [Clostridia bacterium]